MMRPYDGAGLYLIVDCGDFVFLEPAGGALHHNGLPWSEAKAKLSAILTERNEKGEAQKAEEIEWLRNVTPETYAIRWDYRVILTEDNSWAVHAGPCFNGPYSNWDDAWDAGCSEWDAQIEANRYVPKALGDGDGDGDVLSDEDFMEELKAIR